MSWLPDPADVLDVHEELVALFAADGDERHKWTGRPNGGFAEVATGRRWPRASRPVSQSDRRFTRGRVSVLRKQCDSTRDRGVARRRALSHAHAIVGTMPARLT